MSVCTTTKYPYIFATLSTVISTRSVTYYGSSIFFLVRVCPRIVSTTAANLLRTDLIHVPIIIYAILSLISMAYSSSGSTTFMVDSSTTARMTNTVSTAISISMDISTALDTAPVATTFASVLDLSFCIDKGLACPAKALSLVS